MSKIFRHLQGAVLGVSLSIGLAGTTWAAAPGLQVEPPSAKSEAVTRPRIAIVTVTQPAGASRRVADAHADERELSRRLAAFGFEVWIVGPAPRPELARRLREASARVPEGAEVAFLALGQSLGGGDDIFLIPAGGTADVTARPELLETEAVRLGDVLRRLADRRPQELVAIVDECRPVASGRCKLDETVGASNAGLVVSERRSGSTIGSPMAAQSSMREHLLEAMSPEGQSFLQFFENLTHRLERTDLTVGANSRLSPSFTFVPAHFFAGLGTECGRIDANGSPDAVKGLALEPLIQACERELATRPYASWFAQQRDAGREQRAFQLATTSCENRAAASSYRSSYPVGRFLASIDGFIQECDRRLQTQREEQQRNEMREQERRAEEQNRQRREQVEQEAYQRAISSCTETSGISAYLATYPTGRFRSNVVAFKRRCDSDRAEADRRQREDDQRRREQAEQEAYQRAIASCGDRQGANSYLAAYPTGRFRGAVENFLRTCDRPERMGISSRAGWKATYSTRLLRLDPDGDDKTTADGLITTVLKPNDPGDGRVDFFIQSGENQQCQGAEAWAQRVLTRNRPQISGREPVTLSGNRAMFQEGGSFRGDPNVSFMDVVLIPNQDPNMFVHIGVQYPSSDRSKWRDEFARLISSFRLQPTGAIRGRCR